ncbi:MAG: hypothetical protein Q7T49_00295 [bacterium]|nr:hypothetical protein [bacterium]
MEKYGENKTPDAKGWGWGENGLAPGARLLGGIAPPETVHEKEG